MSRSIVNRFDPLDASHVLTRCLIAPGGNLVNRYGYSPIALEWDLWLDPTAPAELAGANVDHGSPSLLVHQVWMASCNML